MKLSIKNFDYNLPPEIIAQEPVKPRDHSRLLLLNKKTGTIHHKHFYDIIDHLQAGDVLVLNNSKVFPARLKGYKKDSGGAVEVFLHQKKTANIWECLLKGRIRLGMIIDLQGGLEAQVIESNNDGTWQVKFNLSGEKFWKVVNKIGEVPLPPYIKRNAQVSEDKLCYQTVFADNNKVGSAAAPTAGLHFTKTLLRKVRAKGAKIVYVTLHVGLGTFAPVKTVNILDHKMHREFVEVKPAAIKTILAAKKKSERVIALGTTSCRAIESIDWRKFIKEEKITTQSFWTDIYIYPGYNFQVVDALITNFHLPKSTLLMLVSALAGEKKIKLAYREAIYKRYRFFSYGDAMFIY